MRIGINALYLLPNQVGGSEVYLRNLLSAISKIDRKNEYFIFSNIENYNTFNMKQDNFREIFCRIKAVSRPKRILWEQVILPFKVKKLNLDILFSPGFTSPFFIPCPSVVTIYDLQLKVFPEYFKKTDLIFWRIFVYISIKRATKIITLSENTKSDIVRFYNQALDKIEVIHVGVNNNFKINPDQNKIEEFKSRYQLPDKIILCVSTTHPHKNYPRLLEAFSLLRMKNNIPHKLVIIGLKGFFHQELIKLINDMDLNDHVRLFGWVPFEDVPLFYKTAELFVFPSEFEGFGIPVLEAFASGLPVVSSNATSLPEVAGNAALMVNPYSVSEIADAMYRIINDKSLSSELVLRGFDRAKLFSWEEAAKRTLDCFVKAFIQAKERETS